MIYTKDLLVKFRKQIESGMNEEESMPAQDLFNACTFLIQQNTPESNETLRNLLQICPDLSLMKNSDWNGCPLLIYAAGMDNVEAVKSILGFTEDINAAEDNLQQTALHTAVNSNHLEIVKLLVDTGADVNVQTKQKQTPLWQACALGRLDMLRVMTVSGADLEIENEDGWTLLHVAAINGHMQIVEYLVNAGVTVDKLGHDKRTALHCATLKKHLDIAKFLVNHGANPNLEDSDERTPLFIATVNKEIELVKLMIKAGADPYLQKNEMDTVFDTALDKNDTALFEVLWSKESTKKMHQALVDNDREGVERLLSENQFIEQELRVFFLFSVKQRQFDTASILLEHKQGLQSQYKRFRSPEQDLMIDQQKGVTRDALHTEIYAVYQNSHKSQLVFQGTPFEDRAEIILDAFTQMSELLCDIPACTVLLRPVDDELKRLLPQLSAIEPQEKMIIKGLLWPTAAPQNYLPLDKKGALRRILRSHLQKHNIETQNELYNFAGFVETETANALVRKGALFKEQFLLGNALTHGLYSHYFQWFLMARAIDIGRVKLQDGLSLKEILQASVDVQTEDKSPAWTLLIDNVSPLTYANYLDNVRLVNTGRYNFFNNIPSRYRLSSVMELSSFLYTSSELPHIRGYLLDSLYKNISKIQCSMEGKFSEDNKIKHSHVIAGQAVSFQAFNRFKIGLSNDDVDKYYEERAKTGGKLDKKTGIVTKPIPMHWATP